MERFFIIVGRINNVLFLLVLLSAAAAIAFISSENAHWRRRGAVAVAEETTGVKKPILLNFDRIEQIAGANTEMMRLTTQEVPAKFASGGSGNETRNLLFLRGNDKVARWLFKDHKNLVLAVAQLRDEAASKDDLPTKAIYVEYVSKDTDGDGKLSDTDGSNIGLARPDGTGFVTVLTDITRVFSYEMYDATHLSVVFQKGSSVRQVKVSISDFKLVSDQEIVRVPNAV